MNYYFFTALFLSSRISSLANACLATSPVQGATTTAAPVTEEPLRRCAPSTLSLGVGDNMQPQEDIDVTFSNYVSTQIGTTRETINTMQVSCTAIDGYNAFMTMDDGFTPPENIDKPQTVTVNFSCNSANMVWNYVTTFQGQDIVLPFTSVMCNQALLNTGPLP
ncbi:hypothetical protein CAEBREN_04529 [Caenorhabditis brenneri]|uniref:C6 domain-containing protein n=1 Tax=Caenorhabditis brenneri TaxID=135651 RepID=G0P544_CAEBE|nr:hypothetical protein CAEBREN_04529 [Caenorhabditis brenneri]